MVGAASGQFLLVAYEKGTFNVFDVFTKAKVVTFETQQKNPIWQLIPNGALVTTTLTDEKETFWNVFSGKPIAVLNRRPGNDLTSYVFDPASNTLLSLDMRDSTCKLGILNADTGNWRFLYSEMNGTPAISPNGKYGAVWQSGVEAFPESWFSTWLAFLGLEATEEPQIYSAIVVYELKTGTKVATLSESQRSVRPPSFSPDGSLLAVAYENEVRVYDFPLRKPWLRITGLAVLAAGLAFGPLQFVAWRHRRRPSAARPRSSGRQGPLFDQ
jgi:WD40 repeat protein